MQVAIYARVSTLNQQQEGTIASQVHLLKQQIQQQSWSLLPEHEFIDEGVSGARLDRPALDRLRDCAQRGEFDAVVVLSPDRLARNYAHQWFLVEEFEKLNTQLIVSLWWGGVPLKNKRISAEKIFLIKGGLW
jgi:site-specific DNA recombinase